MCEDDRVSTLVTGEAVALDVRPASLAARAASCAIDAVAYSLLNIAIFVAAAWALARAENIDSLLLASLTTVLTVLAVVGIPCAVELLTHGRSPGKYALGLRIVRDDGGAISFRHAVLRALLWPIEVLALGGGIAALSGLLSPRCKRLGDHLAGTIAVDERARMPRLAPLRVPARLAGWADAADVTALPGPLLYRVAQFLATAAERAPASRLERAIELAEELNAYVAPAPPAGTHPEEFLAAIVDRSRREAVGRESAAAAEVERFRARVGALPYGLRLSGPGGGPGGP